ncbi:MAG TPA: AraC family transcriptional regulator [Alphaproteobacteria bacterium]|jgi:AraC-like DNA-binding protein|nr:AraC family transcriptional regulator [Alphaproteobacteria bacterium]
MTENLTPTQNPPPLGVPVFAYAGAPRGEAYEIWREGFCRRFCQLDAEPLAAERIECTVEVARVGSLSFGAAHGSSASFLRTRSLLSDGCDDIVLVTAMAGDVLTVQRGRTIALKPGEVGLMSLDDVAECGLSEGGRFTALRIPRPELVGVCRDAEDRLSKPLAGSPRLRDAVSGYFALCTETAGALDAVGQHTMARHMTEMVGLLLRTASDEPPPVLHDGYRAARLQLIQAQLLKQLGDGDLSIVSTARQARLTPKQVQRLFWASGVTFSEFVLEQRLLLAHRLLCGIGGRRDKISAVAYDAGFRDLSYFNRSFRRRFGMTPSEWRDAQPAYS